jgi:putative ABC transport system permease protein
MRETAHSGFANRQLLWNNLRARPLRTALSIVAVAIQVVLILLIVGMTTGVVAEWAKRVEGVGADLLVRPPNSSIFFAFSSAVMQESEGDAIARVPGVDDVAPVLVLVETRTMDVVYGIDYRSFNALSNGFLFRAGRPLEAPDEVVIDDIKVQTKHLRLGDTVNLLGHDFAVCGIVASGKGARYFIPLRTAQDMAGAEGRVSMFYVRSTGNTDETRQALVGLLPNHRILSMAEYLTLMNSSNLPELKPFIAAMVGLGVAISFLVVFLAMHTVVLERTREIGILKSLGASRGNIIGLILEETLLMAGFGVLLGLAATGMTWLVLHRTVPSLTIQIPLEWFFRAVLLALAAAAAGALHPALRAARFDPLDALAYE